MERPPTITIDNIFDGQSDLRYFASGGEFLGSLGIDPDQPASDSGTESFKASGMLRPVASSKVDGTIVGAPMWLVPNPKDDEIYVYGSTGSIYSIDPAGYVLSNVGDLTDGGTASGNGSAYYDNYIYFARDTTIARYGPLNGTASFTDDYWVSSLSQSALVHTTYPTINSHTLPNHPMVFNPQTGRLFFGDVVGNQGTIHYIATTFTSVEGDTNNGSTWNALDLPYGYWPIALENYDTELVVALYEGNNDTVTFQRRAKLAFWDTSASSPNKRTDVEFPDPLISALRNVNGTLYVFSGQLGINGCRVSVFSGGHSFKQVAFISDSPPPFAGAVDGLLTKILFGGAVRDVTGGTAEPSVYGIGSKTGKFNGLHNVMGVTNSSSGGVVTSLVVGDQDGFEFQIPIVGWSDGTNRGIDYQSNNYRNINQRWRSKVFRIGRPFKITKIRMPLLNAVGANMTVVPKIFVDEQGTSHTLATINNTNYPNSERQIILRQDGVVGKHSFFFELVWSGSSLLTIGLPITIEYELLND